MTDSRHIPQEDLALYAMQALTPEESAYVRAHLDTCPECRGELAYATGDLAVIAMSVEQKPLPAGARQRFLARVASDARIQHPALLPDSSNNVPFEPRRPRFRWFVALPWAAVAALVILAAGLVVRNQTLVQQVKQQNAVLQEQNSANARAQELLSLLTAPSAKHVVLTATQAHPAPTARAVYLAERGALLMQASNLNPVTAGQTYELWVIPAKGAPIPAGLFRPDAGGNASVVLPPIPEGVEAKAFGITVEKASGATTPTAPIVLSGAVPASGE